MPEKPPKLKLFCDREKSVPTGVARDGPTAGAVIDVPNGLKLAKCPRWVDQELLFLDVHDRCIKSMDLDSRIQTVKTLPFLPAGFDVSADNALIVGDAWRRKIVRWEGDEPIEIADISDVAEFCLSETIVDGCGGMYFSDVGFGFLDPYVTPVSKGVLVRINGSGNASVVADKLFYPAGMTITPDNRTLIVAEKLAHRLTAFEIRDDGSLENRRVWAQFPDHIEPDGLCLDCEGAVWVAGSDSWALRVWEGGEIDCRIAAKRPVIATMLGGPERRHLFMCTSTSDDPVITLRTPDACIEIVEVRVPGCG